MTNRNDAVLIAVSIRSIRAAPYPGFAETPHKAVIRGESREKDANFVFETGMLIGELTERCHQLHCHGFTVVKAPDDWRYGYYNKPGGWQETVVLIAMEQVAAIAASKQETNTVSSYNEAVAEAVLNVVDEAFPNPLQVMDIKHRLLEEPSDLTLLTALDALYLQGFIDGKPMRSHTDGHPKLLAMANIRITAEGHKRVSGQAQPSSHLPAIHQFINYGQAGAMGPHSTGTINYQQKWVANQVDLSQVVTELQTLKAELRKTAETAADFQQLSIIAEAEQHAAQHDGPKVIEVLSKSSRWLFDFATHVGVELTAKLIAKSMGLEP
jgi:hypothetical protein